MTFERKTENYEKGLSLQALGCNINIMTNPYLLGHLSSCPISIAPESLSKQHQTCRKPNDIWADDTAFTLDMVNESEKSLGVHSYWSIDLLILQRAVVTIEIPSPWPLRIICMGKHWRDTYCQLWIDSVSHRNVAPYPSLGHHWVIPQSRFWAAISELLLLSCHFWVGSNFKSFSKCLVMLEVEI